MHDWDQFDEEAASEGRAMKGGFSMTRHNKSKAPPSRQAIGNDYRVVKAHKPKIDHLALNNVVDGRKT
jgi:hypothetical protein